jgi:anti-sigma-K factor RskA
MTQNLPFERNDDMLAAEYVTGVLPVAERELFKTRLVGDAALRQRVQFWEEQFIPLADEIEPVEAPRHVLQKIESRLFPAAVVRPSWWQSLAFWRGLSFASLAAFAVAAGLYFKQLESVPISGENYVAELSGPTDTIKVVAFYDQQTGQIKLNRIAGTAAAGRVFQLWLIEGQNPPVSLGVLPETTTGTLVFNSALKSKLAGAVLAISDEPIGGSPTGQPTGAVLATGNVHVI